MEQKISELTSLLFKTKQLVREGFPAQHDPTTWLRLEILNFISHRRDTTMRNIADYLRVKPPSATSLVATLEREGLIKRDKDGKDRRSVHVSLTTKGDKALLVYRSAASHALQKVFSKLDQKEIETLIAILKRLHSAHQ